MRRLLLAAWLLTPTAAFSEPGQCNGWENLRADTKIGLAKVTSGPRANFIKDATEENGCPNATAACLRESFLVTGDEVITSARQDDYVCAQYVTAKGLATTGWLPAAALSAVPATPAVSTKDWDGTWTGNVEQIIRVSPGAAYQMVAIDGQATFGALDPERIKRGAVNSGSFSVRLRIRGDSAGFALDDNGASKPWSDGTPDECRIAMRRLGAFLLVEDNGLCGGHNVSFTGNYRRN